MGLLSQYINKSLIPFFIMNPYITEANLLHIQSVRTNYITKIVGLCGTNSFYIWKLFFYLRLVVKLYPTQY